MGGAILVVVGVFFVLHSLLLDVKLWPYLLILIGIVTILVSHFKKSRSFNNSLFRQKATFVRLRTGRVF